MAEENRSLPGLMRRLAGRLTAGADALRDVVEIYKAFENAKILVTKCDKQMQQILDGKPNAADQRALPAAQQALRNALAVCDSKLELVSGYIHEVTRTIDDIPFAKILDKPGLLKSFRIHRQQRPRYNTDAQKLDNNTRNLEAGWEIVKGATMEFLQAAILVVPKETRFQPFHRKARLALGRLQAMKAPAN